MSEEIDNRPKNAFEAAIDAATGYEPGDENRVVSDAAQDGQGESGGAEGEPATASVQQQVDPVPAKEKRDWVNEAYECFIKNAVDLEPTEPAGAVWEYFKKNATDELKAKVEAEGKTGVSCWKFIEAVARKALGGKSGHIDPVAVYAIAMHYFQDVPNDWDRVEKPKTAKVHAGIGKKAAETRKTNAKIEKLKEKIAQPGSAKHAQELKAKLKAEKEKLKEKEKKQKAKKRGGEQGFFFDLMETETVGPDAGNGGVAAAEQDGKEAGDAE